MAKNNPFSLTFGIIPEQYIARISQTREIADDFRLENPNSRVYILTGVRGSGKTVLMTEIAGSFDGEKDWIVIHLNPERDMLRQMGACLCEIPELKRSFVKANLDIKVFGSGLTIERDTPVTDIEILIRKMLKEIHRRGKRLLITVDEVTNNRNVKEFASAFQIMLREGAPLYLLMTGLYENIYSLQNEKSLTFLYRAPKIKLESLRIPAISDVYCRVFKIPEKAAMEMARMTCGYSFAFQVLGYLCWDNHVASYKKVIPQFDLYMEEYVYEKIWSELSSKDQTVIIEIVRNPSDDITVLREKLGVSPQMFYQYKKRLEHKGIIESTGHGTISVQLPRFAEFVERMVG